ncbi:hypothetical protein ACIGEP_15505 [Microbacterium sp. NPDC077663]|uniref:hypothetical protein n=1 Tax=Microbacterium sp. NPDC077663 TaxID=3364189 RepID=UPI0037CA4588
MGYIDANGAYIYEETDIADPGAGFSELLNQGTRRVPALVRTRVVAELNDDENIRQVAAERVQEEVDGLRIVTEEPAPDWYWRIKYENGETAIGRRGDKSVVFPGGEPTVEIDADWLWRIRYQDGEVAIGRKRDGTVVFPGLGSSALSGLCLVGDSLTANRSASANAELAAATGGRPTTVVAIGGQSPNQIVAMYGGAPGTLTVSGGVIPASGTVTVTADSANMGNLASAGVRSFDGVLGGVPGVYRVETLGGGAYARSFTRTTAGMAVAIPNGAPFQTGFNYRRSKLVIRVGRNGVRTQTAAAIVEKIGRALDWAASPSDAIVLSVPAFPGDEKGTANRVQLDALNAAIAAAFPTQWLDDSAALTSTAALDAAGITPTTQDQTDLGNGMIPTSFRVSSTDGHWNAAAYGISNRLIAALGNAKWKD